MLFNSLTYCLFFLSFYSLHRLLPNSLQNTLIILGSLIFYAWWNPIYIWIPIVLIVISYFGTKLIVRVNKKYKKITLLITLISLYLPLLIYKYLDFFYSDIAKPILNLPEKSFDYGIPLGISFITFTLTTYILDVFKKKFIKKVNLSNFISYVLFFPQLISGPILRPNELIPKLENFKKSKNNKFTFAFSIFTIGLVKKVIFGDYIGSTVVDPIFKSNLYEFDGLTTLLSIYAFSVQIYCDFSGYMDMAIGSSLMLGIELPINFNSPYSSSSLIEFWRKWHITLSNLLRDYLYIPLGGNRFGIFKQFRNILITMLIGGLWHGSSWNFIIWGLFHAFGIIINRLFEITLDLKNNLLKPLTIFFTFNYVTFLWIFFRSKDLSQAINIIKNILYGSYTNYSLFLEKYNFILLLLIVFFFTHKLDNKKFIFENIKKIRREFLIPIILSLWMLVISFSQVSSGTFIYFDF